MGLDQRDAARAAGNSHYDPAVGARAGNPRRDLEAGVASRAIGDDDVAHGRRLAARRIHVEGAADQQRAAQRHAWQRQVGGAAAEVAAGAIARQGEVNVDAADDEPRAARPRPGLDAAQGQRAAVAEANDQVAAGDDDPAQPRRRRRSAPGARRARPAGSQTVGQSLDVALAVVIDVDVQRR